jgi:hypothetical protein
MADQRAVRGFVGRLELDHPLPALARSYQLKILPPQPFSRLGKPGLIGIVGQEVAGVLVRNRCGHGPISRGERCVRVALELDGIDVQLGDKGEDPRLDGEHVLRGQRPPSVVQGLAQVRSCRLGAEVGPQGLHHLLARDPVRRGQRQELHEVGGSTAPPGVGRDATSFDPDSEAAQKFDGAGHRHGPAECTQGATVKQDELASASKESGNSLGTDASLACT